MNSLTKQCIHLADGKLVTFGKTPTVIEEYLAEGLTHRGNGACGLDFYRRDRFAETPLRLTQVWVNGISHELPTIDIGSTFTILVEMEAKAEMRGASLTVILKNTQGDRAVVLFSWDQTFSLFLRPGTHVIEVKVEGLPLAPGQYYADIGVNQSTQTQAYDVVVDLPVFRVVNKRQVVHWLDRPWGSVHWNKVEWKLLSR